MFAICVFFSFCLLSVVVSVPVSVISNENSSNKIEDIDDLEIIDDDITTRSMERLSSAATCLVAGIEYTHGQQINRIDPCEFCLCLDGEMFCWWQDCPPAIEGPCKDKGPFSQCVNIPANEIPQDSSTKVTPTTPNKITSSPLNQQNIQQSKDPSTSSTTNFSTITSSSESNDVNKEQSTTQTPQFCIVMGIQYKVGEQLPHDTGNCVECICGPGAKITCSPHQCAPAEEELSDYHPVEPRRSNIEGF